MSLSLSAIHEALDFFDIKLTIGIMYTNLIGTKDVLRLI